MHGSEHEAGGGGDSTHSQSGSESGADSAAAGSGSDTENSDDDDQDELEEEGVDEDQLDSSLEEDEVGGDQCDLHGDEGDMFGAEDEDFDVPSGDTPGEDSGTTACVALVHSNKHLFVANIGDSRAVVGSSGGRVPVELSADHKPEDEVELKRIQAAGGRVTADGRVNGGLNLSRAFGDHFYKKTDSKPLEEQMISALPDVSHYELKENDRFLIIACDGIWNSLTSGEVVRFVNERLDKDEDLDDICKQLCDACLADDTSGDGTGCDNMTVVLVRFKGFRPAALPVANGHDV